MNIKISEAVKLFGLSRLTSEKPEEKSITNVYIGDLLSWVMGYANEDCAWITIQGHVNIVAVALLVEAGCIIVCEGAEVSPDTIEKAEAEGIALLSSDLPEYELAKKFVLFELENR